MLDNGLSEALDILITLEIVLAVLHLVLIGSFVDAIGLTVADAVLRLGNM